MRSLRSLGLAVCLAFVTIAAQAVTITFDEFPADDGNGPMPAGRYAAFGVTFVATDDGSTWGGISNGDPGNWDLDGTNGPIFSGFNGGSYGLTMLFSGDVNGFSLQASRSLGSIAGDTFTLEGWNNGALVESHTIVFGAINDWSTLALLAAVDEVRWFGIGQSFHPFGIDNVQWDVGRVVPEPGPLVLVALGAALIAFSRRRRYDSR